MGWPAALVRPGVDDFPVAGGGGVDVADGVLLGGEGGGYAAEGVAVGVLGPGGEGLAVHFVDGVGGAVDVHVEAEAEEVLVVGGGEVGVDEGAGLEGGAVGRGFVGHGFGEDDAGEFDVDLDGSVFVEVPVEARSRSCRRWRSRRRRGGGSGGRRSRCRLGRCRCASRGRRRLLRGCRWRWGRWWARRCGWSRRRRGR